jgi:hypothetical protein
MRDVVLEMNDQPAKCHLPLSAIAAKLSALRPTFVAILSQERADADAEDVVSSAIEFIVRGVLQGVSTFTSESAVTVAFFEACQQIARASDERRRRSCDLLDLAVPLQPERHRRG